MSNYYPYGEEKTVTADEQLKFATYRRDSESRLDYAVNRYYSSAMGRFLSPDPKSRSMSIVSPSTFNRYSYVMNDPVNRDDPTGQWCTGDSSDGCNGTGDENGEGGDGDGSGVEPTGGSGTTDDPYTGWGGEGTAVPDPDPAPDSPPDWGPDPEAPADPTTPTLPNSPPSLPWCSAKLEFRKVKGLVASHASIVVDDSFDFTFTMEGTPSLYPIPAGKLLAFNVAGDIGDVQWGPELTSASDPALCGQITAMEYAEDRYNARPVDYNFVHGPNSNTLAHWLLTQGGIAKFFSAPPLSYGWDTPLYSAPTHGRPEGGNRSRWRRF